MTIESFDKDCGNSATIPIDEEPLLYPEVSNAIDEEFPSSSWCGKILELFFILYYIPFLNCIVPYICFPYVCVVCFCPWNSTRSMRCLTLFREEMKV